MNPLNNFEKRSKETQRIIKRNKGLVYFLVSFDVLVFLGLVGFVYWVFKI